MNKKQKIFAIFTLGLVLFLLFGNTGKIYALQTSSTPMESGGTTIGGITPSVVGVIFGVINNIIGFIGGTLFSLAGGLTNFTLLLNFDILNNPMINVGWGIARDLTNLGFVLFIIIIAIATILRIQQYGAKNTLGKLIAVALLVNFSLLFAGIFIDFSNMLTNFFIKSITPGGNIGGLGPSLADAFKIQNLNAVKSVAEMGSMQGVMQFGLSMEKGIASSFFIAAFTFIGAFSLLALAIMFLIRYIALSILLILVPLACLFIILPATGKLFGQWSSQFMKWIIFAPAASFFLYLSVYMTINYGKLMDSLATASQGIGTANQMNFANLTIDKPLQTIGRMVIAIGLLLGGLITANSMGIAGSKASMGLLQTAGKWARGTIGKMGAAAATRPLRGAWAQKQIENMQKAGLGGGRFARAIGRPLRTIGGALSTAGVQQGEKMVQQAEAGLKRFASDKSLASALPTLNHTDQIAAIKRLTKNKTMNLVDDRVLDSMIGNKNTKNMFGRYGAGKEYGDFEKAAGRNYEMVTGTAKEAAAVAFHSTFSPKDYEMLRTKAVTDDANANATIAAIIQTNPGALAKLMPKLKSSDLDNFNKKFDGILNREIDETIYNIDSKMDIGKMGGTKQKLEWMKEKIKERSYIKFETDYNRLFKINDSKTRNLGNRMRGYAEAPTPPAA